MKLSKIKETFDKLKEYRYELQIKENGLEFQCFLYVNSLLISIGEGKKKQNAKQDCADKGYHQLMECDSEFAAINGKRIPYGDFFEILRKYCNDYQIQFIGEKNDQPQYKYYSCTCGLLKTEGYGLTCWKARNVASYNMYLLLMARVDRNQTPHHLNGCEKLNIVEPKQQQPNQLQIPNVSQQLQSLQSNQQHYLATTGMQQQLSQESVKQQSQQNGQLQQAQQHILKVEYQELQINQQQLQNNSTIAYKLSKELGISDEIYSYFSQFLSRLSASSYHYETVGSFSYQSLRITKPIMDLVVEVLPQQELNFMEYLANLEKEMDCKKEVRVDFIHIQFNKTFNEYRQLQFQSLPSLQARLYILPHQITSTIIYHTNYMMRFEQKFKQLNFATQSLMLMHQWRDVALAVLPVEVLDYLIAQITNEFSYLNSPYQVLCQIIFLLKQGILEEIKQYPKMELNPFLQSISTFYIEKIQKLPNEELVQIKDGAALWNKPRLDSWLQSFQ